MSSEDIADLDGYEFHDGANFEQENNDKFNAEKYTTVGRLSQLKQNEMTATRMALEDVVFESPVHTTGKKLQLNWTRLQKTGLSVAVQAFRKLKTA